MIGLSTPWEVFANVFLVVEWFMKYPIFKSDLFGPSFLYICIMVLIILRMLCALSSYLFIYVYMVNI